MNQTISHLVTAILIGLVPWIVTEAILHWSKPTKDVRDDQLYTAFCFFAITMAVALLQIAQNRASLQLVDFLLAPILVTVGIIVISQIPQRVQT